MLTAQTNENRQFDWGTVLRLFSSGIKLVGGQLSGKLTFIETLWESYQDSVSYTHLTLPTSDLV